MSVIVMPAKPWSIQGTKFYGFKLVEESEPSVSLNLLKHYSLVLTITLNGSIFLNIFEKDFWYVKDSMYNLDYDNRLFY